MIAADWCFPVVLDVVYKMVVTSECYGEVLSCVTDCLLYCTWQLETVDQILTYEHLNN